jgi:hypothetical protein
MKIALFAALAALCLGHSVAARTLTVAMNGEDGPDCGDDREPCRTITRAIANAAGGDVIEVGPGLYGDLNRDNDLNDPGEEAAFGMGCSCAVDLNKRVTLVSRDGADVTIIDAGPASRAVRINVPGATLGAQNGGFTLVGGNNGVVVPADIVDVRVIGNTSRGAAGDGFFSEGDVRYETNRSIRSGSNGFNTNEAEVTVQECVAQANAAAGFYFTSSDSRVRKSVAVGNGDFGLFTFQGTDQFHGVASLANEGGVYYSQSSEPLRGSSVFGNGITNASNCGIGTNLSGLAMPGNFWGAAAGPGPEPADAQCPASADISLAPARKTEVKVAPKATR